MHIYKKCVSLRCCCFLLILIFIVISIYLTLSFSVHVIQAYRYTDG